MLIFQVMAEMIDVTLERQRDRFHQPQQTLHVHHRQLLVHMRTVSFHFLQEGGGSILIRHEKHRARSFHFFAKIAFGTAICTPLFPSTTSVISKLAAMLASI